MCLLALLVCPRSFTADLRRLLQALKRPHCKITCRPSPLRPILQQHSSTGSGATRRYKETMKDRAYRIKFFVEIIELFFPWFPNTYKYQKKQKTKKRNLCQRLCFMYNTLIHPIFILNFQKNYLLRRNQEKTCWEKQNRQSFCFDKHDLKNTPIQFQSAPAFLGAKVLGVCVGLSVAVLKRVNFVYMYDIEKQPAPRWGWNV